MIPARAELTRTADRPGTRPGRSSFTPGGKGVLPTYTLFADGLGYLKVLDFGTDRVAFAPLAGGATAFATAWAARRYAAHAPVAPGGCVYLITRPGQAPYTGVEVVAN